MAFKTVEVEAGNQFKFEKEGETLTGYYMGTATCQGERGPYQRYTFQTKEGAISFNGSTSLNEQMPKVPVGALTQVTYKGAVRTKKGGSFKKYTVQYDDSDMYVEGGQVEAPSKAKKPDASALNGLKVAA